MSRREQVLRTNRYSLMFSLKGIKISLMILKAFRYIGESKEYQHIPLEESVTHLEEEKVSGEKKKVYFYLLDNL